MFFFDFTYLSTRRISNQFDIERTGTKSMRKQEAEPTHDENANLRVSEYKRLTRSQAYIA